MKKYTTTFLVLFIVSFSYAQNTLLEAFDVLKKQTLYRVDLIKVVNNASLNYTTTNKPGPFGVEKDAKIDFYCSDPSSPGSSVGCNGYLIDNNTAVECDFYFGSDNVNGQEVVTLQSRENKVCMFYKSKIVFATLPTAQFDNTGKIISFKPSLLPPVVVLADNPGADFKAMTKALRLELQSRMEEIANKIYPIVWQEKEKLYAAGEGKYSRGINDKIAAAVGKILEKNKLQASALVKESGKQKDEALQSEKNFIERFDANLDNGTYGDFRAIITDFYDADTEYEFVKIKRWKSERGKFADTYSTEVIKDNKPNVTKVYQDDDATKQCIGIQIKETGSTNNITGGILVKNMNKKINFFLHDPDENENPKGGHFMTSFFYKGSLYVKFKDGYENIKTMEPAYTWYIVKPKSLPKPAYNFSMFDLELIVSDYLKRDKQLNTK